MVLIFTPRHRSVPQWIVQCYKWHLCLVNLRFEDRMMPSLEKLGLPYRKTASSPPDWKRSGTQIDGPGPRLRRTFGWHNRSDLQTVVDWRTTVQDISHSKPP